MKHKAIKAFGGFCVGLIIGFLIFGEPVFSNTFQLLQYMQEKKVFAIPVSIAEEYGIEFRGLERRVQVKLRLRHLIFMVEILGGVDRRLLILPPAGSYVLLDYYIVPLGWYKIRGGYILHFNKSYFYGANPFRLYLLEKRIRLPLLPFFEESIGFQQKKRLGI